MRNVAGSIAALLALAILGLLPRYSAAAELNFPAQSLGESLRSLGNQTKTNVLFDPDFVRNLNAPAVSAANVAEALSRLLVGSGLAYRFIDARTVTLFPADATPSAESKTSGLNPTSTGSALHLVQAAGQGQSSGANAPQEGAQKSESEGSASGDKVQEIIVTAQKREELLSKVPVSISVLSGRELDSSNASGVAELLARVPGVATRPSDGASIIVIRGVAPAATDFNSGSTTAYYLDAVPFGFIWSPMLPDSNAYDLERVEVLRGPQGTLYGASALNGVVRVLTHDADLKNFDLKARTSISSTEGGGENYRADLAVNVPIIEDKLAARAVVGYADYSGWIDNLNKKDANHINLNNLRLKVNSRPTDALSIGLSVWKERDPRGSQDVSNDDNVHSTTLETETLNEFTTYAATIGYDFQSFSVKSMSSYLDYDSDGITDIGPDLGATVSIPYIRRSNSKAFAQEFALTSTTDGPWRWSAGGIYRDEEEKLWIDIPGFLPGPFGQLFTSKSFAVYGQITRLFMDDRFELSAGVRYFEDKVEVADYLPRSGIPGDTLVQGKPRNFDAVTPRAVLTWNVNPNLIVYGAYSQGFRSGYDQGIDTVRFYPDFPAVEPDKLTNYEIGTKGASPNGLVSFDASVYYVDWKDVQLNTSLPIPGTDPVIYTAVGLNATSVDGIGTDIALTLHPARGLDFGGSISWNALENNDLLLSAGLPVLVQGQRLNLSPKYTASVFVDYTFPMMQSYKGRFSASANRSSEIIKATPGSPSPIITHSDSLLIARASFTVLAPSNWEFSAFVENLTNENGALFPPEVVAGENTRIRPRTMGLQAEYHFR